MCAVETVPRNYDTRQEYFLKRAAYIATRSCMNHRHGCIIVDKNDEILAEGYNHKYFHFYHAYSIHAEVSCLSKIKWRKSLTDCEMYLVRIGTDRMGKPLKYSKPCQECTKAILKSGIRRVYYSTDQDCCIAVERILFHSETREDQVLDNNDDNRCKDGS
jgi:deoxycytidylate deaminase